MFRAQSSSDSGLVARRRLGAALIAALVGVAFPNAFTSGAESATNYKRYTDLPAIASISPDGSYALFETYSALVPQDTNTVRDVYRMTFSSGTITLVSRGPSGTALGGRLPDRSDARLLSSGGRYAVIESNANVSGNVTDGKWHLYRVDLSAGTAALVDIASSGSPGSAANPTAAGISSDGMKVAFVSSSQLVSADSNSYTDLYIRDFTSPATTKLLSVSSSGAAIGNVSSWASLSTDGSTVVFAYAGQAYGSPLNSSWALYTRTVSSPTVTRISGNGALGQPPISLAPLAISSDGAQVAYATDQSFSSADTNDDVDVYVWNRANKTHTWVSRPQSGSGASPATRLFTDVSFSGSTLVLGSNVPLSPAAAPAGDFSVYHWNPTASSPLTVVAPVSATTGATPLGNTTQSGGSKVFFDAGSDIWEAVL